MEDTKDSKDSLKDQNSVMGHIEGSTEGECVEESIPALHLMEIENDGKGSEGSEETEKPEESKESENSEETEKAKESENSEEPEEERKSANLEESREPEAEESANLEESEDPEEQEEREWREWKERRQARSRQQENPVREWISDNLRYMLLILAIAIVVVAIVLGVKLFSDRMSGEDGRGNSNVSGESQSTAEGSDSEDSGEAGGVTITPDAKASVTATPTATPTVTPTATPTEAAAPTPTATPTATPAATPTEEPDGLERARSDVSEVVERYFEALGARDTETLSAYMEQLTEEDRAAVEANQQIGGYSNITVYSYKGAQDNSYVVLASYTYRYQGYDTEIPGLTQLYVFQKEDGKLCIASENTEANLETYINQVLEREDVQQLITEVQAQYNEVMNNHPELQSYMESLGR